MCTNLSAPCDIYQSRSVPRSNYTLLLLAFYAPFTASLTRLFDPVLLKINLLFVLSFSSFSCWNFIHCLVEVFFWNQQFGMQFTRFRLKELQRLFLFFSHYLYSSHWWKQFSRLCNIIFINVSILYKRWVTVVAKQAHSIFLTQSSLLKMFQLGNMCLNFRLL